MIQETAAGVANRTSPITSWQDFNRVSDNGRPTLLNRLARYPEAVLVTGCQRSGTTMLTQILLESDGLTDYRFGRDSELDGALILSGIVDHNPAGRYCFQTTYLNDRYNEYFENGRFQMIWLLRNPASVVHSMLHNWGGYKPDRLFLSCGAQSIRGLDRWRYKLFGLKGLSLLRRACWGYNGKTMQVFELYKRLGPSVMMIVDYDELVLHKQRLLPRVFEFLGLTFKPEYLHKIRSTSLAKKLNFTKRQLRLIEKLSGSVYRRARRYRTV